MVTAEIALFIAPIPIWPGTYYYLLRFLIFAVCCCLLYWLHRGTEILRPHRMFILLIACVFNPFAVIPIDPGMWIVIDLAVGTYFIAVTQQLKGLK